MEGRTSASVGWVLSRDVYFKGTCIHSRPPACLCPRGASGLEELDSVDEVDEVAW